MAEAEGIETIVAASLEALEGGAELEEVLGRYPGREAELKPLLEAAGWLLSKRQAVEPRVGFVRASRARLMEQIAAQQALRRQSWLERMIGALAGGVGQRRRYALQAALAVLVVACLVVGSTGAALASQQALPGELLYPVKLGLEQVELLVTLDAAGDIRLHTQFAQLRLLEMERLLALGRYDRLAIAADNYRYHLDRALALLRLLAAQSPAQAQQLAFDLAGVFFGQADRLAVLAGIPPAAAASELDAAEQAAREAAREAEQIGQQPGEALPAPATSTPTAVVAAVEPRPSATPLPPGSTPGQETPVPSSTVTPVWSSTPTSTPAVSATPTPNLSAQASATPTARASATAKPSATATQKPTATPTKLLTTTPTATRPTATPTATQTLQPSATQTGQPTSTPITPTPTATVAPPTPTATIAPPPTRTPKPTQTPPLPTNTPVPTPYPGPPVYPPP